MRERERVLDPAGDDAIVINGLARRYRSLSALLFGCGGTDKVAVRGISVGIKKNECFGLLGVNGAGKTTTFKMLTGDETVTAGTAVLNGHDIRTAMQQVRRQIGYCPQFDALIELMTGRELLVMYARLRGIPAANVDDEVTRLINLLALEKHADKLSWTYSGGNKRKLSTAIALVGRPPIVFLDEPTTGVRHLRIFWSISRVSVRSPPLHLRRVLCSTYSVHPYRVHGDWCLEFDVVATSGLQVDPGARRFLWDALLEVLEDGAVIVLTSHSMEECEALCTRLTIVRAPSFSSLGSPYRRAATLKVHAQC